MPQTRTRLHLDHDRNAHSLIQAPRTTANAPDPRVCRPWNMRRCTTVHCAAWFALPSVRARRLLHSLLRAHPTRAAVSSHNASPLASRSLMRASHDAFDLVVLHMSQTHPHFSTISPHNLTNLTSGRLPAPPRAQRQRLCSLTTAYLLPTHNAQRIHFTRPLVGRGQRYHTHAHSHARRRRVLHAYTRASLIAQKPPGSEASGDSLYTALSLTNTNTNMHTNTGTDTNMEHARPHTDAPT